MIDLYGGSVEIFFTGKDNVARNVTNIAFGQTTGGSKQFVNFVHSVRLKTSILNFTEIEVAFTPPWEQAVRMINSGLLGLGFQGKSTNTKQAVDVNDVSGSPQNFGFNTISLRLHYGGKKSPWYKGILLSPDFDVSPEDIAITVKAIGMFFPSTKTSSKEIFSSATRRQIFEKVSESLKENVEIQFNPEDARCKDAFDVLEDYNSSETDIRTMKEMLSRTNCVIRDKGMKGPSGKPVFEIISKDFLRKIGKNAPTFVLRKQINPNKNIFPLLALQTTINNFVLGQSLGIQQSVFSNETKQQEDPKNAKISGNIIPQFSDSRASPDSSTPGQDENKNQSLPSVHGPSVLKDAFKGLFMELTDAPLQYTLKTVGIVDMSPGGMARLDIAGVKFLSGDYEVYEVEHSFSSNGVETNIVLARTYGIGGLINFGATKAVANITQTASGNTQTAKSI